MKQSQRLAVLRQPTGKGTRVGFCGEGIQAVHTMLDLYEEFLPHLTPVIHKDAWAEAGRRINETQRKTDKLGV